VSTKPAAGQGATFAGDRFGVTSGVQDRALLDFIAMVRATPTARLVLTTREHVYYQALDRSERLRHAGLGDLRVLLAMPSYSQMQRARILYNHLYFSDLPDLYREELLRDNFYLRIVKHDKFNPRLIQWLSNYRRLRSVPVDRYRTFVENLLRDPSEIWRHAYEQEIIEARRSVLLSLRSLDGKSGAQFLRSAFMPLHHARAARYHFSTRPEDFRSGLREVANSFIKPTGAHFFEAIDPSVLDLLNAVIRAAPENAVDIVAAAVNFDRIEQIWRLAMAATNADVLDTLAREVGRLFPTVARLAAETRRFETGSGAVGFRATTYEGRLTVIVQMAERLASAELAAFVATIMARLVEWIDDGTNINDALGLLRALEANRFLPADDARNAIDEVRDAILVQARNGCNVDELREVINVLDASAHPEVKVAALESFVHLEQRYFSDELRECRSEEQFDGLVEDLGLFRDELSVNVVQLIERVEQARAEFMVREDDRSDHMQDEWKHRNYSERDADRSISGMFLSLRDD
jgi:hypothetical protein